MSGGRQSDGAPEHASPEGTSARAVRLAVAGAALVGAAVALGVSLVSYERLGEHLDAFTVDRDADVTRAEFDAIVWRLRVVGAGLAAAAVLLVRFGSTFDRVAASVAVSWWRAIRGAPRALRAWLAAEDLPYVVALAVVLAVAVGVRLASLDVPMRYDEATTYNNFVSKPLHVALANYATPNNHLLQTFLAKVSTSVLGNEPWTVRLPALLAGVALVPATFALGRVLFGRAAALLAAALVAGSSTLVEYSTNARGYTLVALLTVVAFLGAARSLESDSPGAWALVAVALALGLYAVPVMIYPAGGVLAWLLASGRAAGRPLRPLVARLGACALLAGALTLVLYAPVYAASGVRSVTANEFVEPQSWSTLLDLLPEHAWRTVESWARDLPTAVDVLLAVGLVGGMALTPWISRYRVPPLLTILAWALAVLLAQRVVPFTRVWLFLVPVAAVTAAGFWGLPFERRASLRRAAALLGVVVACGGALAVVSEDSVRTSRETGALLDAPAVAEYLAGAIRPGDRVLATGSDTILEYYLERDGIDAGPYLYTDEPRARTFLVVNVLGGQSADQLVGELAAMPGELTPPALLRSYPSARVYLVERRA